MSDIISVIVVVAFLVIVFRKRLAPLFKGKKKALPDAVPDPSCQQHTDALPGFLYCELIVFNMSGFDPEFDESDLEGYFNGKLFDRLQVINMKGQIESIGYRCNDDVLFIFVTWRLSLKGSGERK